MVKNKFFVMLAFRLVFSQSLLSLDLIENFLAHWDKMVTVDADKQVYFVFICFIS